MKSTKSTKSAISQKLKITKKTNVLKNLFQNIVHLSGWFFFHKILRILSTKSTMTQKINMAIQKLEQGQMYNFLKRMQKNFQFVIFFSQTNLLTQICMRVRKFKENEKKIPKCFFSIFLKIFLANFFLLRMCWNLCTFS